VQQPADHQHHQQTENDHATGEQERPGALAHPARHRQQEVDDGGEPDYQQRDACRPGVRY